MILPDYDWVVYIYFSRIFQKHNHKQSEAQRAMLLCDLDNEEKLQMEKFTGQQHDEETKEKAKTQTVAVRNIKSFDMFQFIDRPKGNSLLTSTHINRDWVCVISVTTVVSNRSFPYTRIFTVFLTSES